MCWGSLGCIRTLLAIVVVVGHSYGYVFTGPIIAVQVFFIISGFLISFVLTEARTYDRSAPFYLNRFLRLFPIYWVVALGTFATLVASEVILSNPPPAFEVFREVDLLGKLALIFSNVFILGQDWIMFTGVRDGTLQIVSDYSESEVIVWHGLLIPPAWTLGVELSFYLVAPFVLFRPKLMILLLISSLILRLLLIVFGPGLDDPWIYRFFPTELALFLAGALSHQFWKQWLDKMGHLTKRNAIIVTGLVFTTCIVFSFLPYRNTSWVLLLIAVTAALPFLFQFQRQFRWDRWIGELSYPVYITHWSILYPLSFLWDRALGVAGYKGLDETLVLIVLTVSVSIFLNYHVANRIERLRTRVKTREIAVQDALLQPLGSGRRSG